MKKEKINEHLLVYEDAFDHIRKLADLEWNGMITLGHFRDRIHNIIKKVSQLETKSNHIKYYGLKRNMLGGQSLKDFHQRV